MRTKGRPCNRLLEFPHNRYTSTPTHHTHRRREWVCAMNQRINKRSGRGEEAGEGTRRGGERGGRGEWNGKERRVLAGAGRRVRV